MSGQTQAGIAQTRRDGAEAISTATGDDDTSRTLHRLPQTLRKRRRWCRAALSQRSSVMVTWRPRLFSFGKKFTTARFPPENNFASSSLLAPLRSATPSPLSKWVSLTSFLTLALLVSSLSGSFSVRPRLIRPSCQQLPRLKELHRWVRWILISLLICPESLPSVV